jgi:hypothetical protein
VNRYDNFGPESLEVAEMDFCIEIANEAVRLIIPFQILGVVSYFVLRAKNRPSYARAAGLWLPSASSLLFFGSWFVYVAYQVSTEKPQLFFDLVDGVALAFYLMLAIVAPIVNLIVSALHYYFVYSCRGAHEAAQEVTE